MDRQTNKKTLLFSRSKPDRCQFDSYFRVLGGVTPHLGVDRANWGPLFKPHRRPNFKKNSTWWVFAVSSSRCLGRR